MQKTRKQRFSPQRESILQIVLKAKDHLSVDEIYNSARASMPRISLGTVYRNLKTLEEMKQVCHTQGPNSETYFEAYREPHHHFICNVCGLLKNLDEQEVKVCTACISQKVPVKIETVVTTVYGLCEGCRE